jgi:transposase
VENSSQIKKWVPAPPLVGVELNPGPPRLPTEDRWAIVRLAKNQKKKKPPKLNYSEIAREVGCSRDAVKNVLNRYEATGSVEDLPGRGRKRKFSEKETKKIIKKSKKGKFAPEIARECRKKVSTRTVQRQLKRGGVKYFKIKKIEKLTQAHMERRVEYSNEMKGYEWNRVLFSDEKTFYLGASPEYAWQDPENRIEEEITSYPEKLNVWGAIGKYMKTKLYYFNENLKTDLYTKILNHCLDEKRLTFSPTCPKKVRENWYFLQDNARYHTSAKSMKKIEEMVGDHYIEHPAKSPDLNPMEDMWSYLDRKVKQARCKTMKSLKRTLTQAWSNLDWKYVAKSVNSMDRRLQQCIDVGGRRLKY